LSLITTAKDTKNRGALPGAPAGAPAWLAGLEWTEVTDCYIEEYTQHSCVLDLEDNVG